MKFDDLSLEKLRDLARSKKGHPGLKGFTTMKKDDLKKAIKKHFKVGGGSLEERANPLIKGDQYRLRTDVAGTGRKKDPFKAMNETLKKRNAPKKNKNPYPAPKGEMKDNLEDFAEPIVHPADKVVFADGPINQPEKRVVPQFRNQKYRALNPEKALLEEAEYNRAHGIATKTPIAALRTAYEHRHGDDDSDSSADYFVIPDDVHAEMVRNSRGGTLQEMPDEIIRKIEGYLPFEGTVGENFLGEQTRIPHTAIRSGQPRLSEILNHPEARTADRTRVPRAFFDTTRQHMRDREEVGSEIYSDAIFGERDNMYAGAPEYTSIDKPRKHKRIGENPLGSPLERNQFDLDLPMRKKAKGGKLVQVLRNFVDKIKARRDARGSGPPLQRTDRSSPVKEPRPKKPPTPVKGGQVSESVKHKARDLVVGGANMTKTNYLTPCWRGYETVPGKEVYTKGSCRKIGGKGAEEDDDDIDFDDIKWGKFTDQLNRYNSQNKKNLDLCGFADLILSNPKKYTMTTQRRARFYKNVLAKKKC